MKEQKQLMKDYLINEFNVVIKSTKIEAINKAIEKAEQKNASTWVKLQGASAETKLKMYSCAEISKTFCESRFIDDKQREILSKKNIIEFVKNSDKYKNKGLFTVNDIKLICNQILKEKDSRIKIAMKVAKQGGQIKQ